MVFSHQTAASCLGEEVTRLSQKRVRKTVLMSVAHIFLSVYFVLGPVLMSMDYFTRFPQLYEEDKLLLTPFYG